MGDEEGSGDEESEVQTGKGDVGGGRLDEAKESD